MAKSARRNVSGRSNVSIVPDTVESAPAVLPEQEGDVAPNQHLRELQAFLTENRMSQTELARRTGYSRQTIFNLVNGHSPITQRTSAALGMVTSRDATYWLNRQQECQSAISSENDQARALSQQRPAANVPMGGNSTQVDFQIQNLVDRGEIEILPIHEPEQIQPSSIDLRFSGHVLGARISSKTSGSDKSERAGRFPLSDSEDVGCVELLPWQAVTLVTYEKIQLSENFIGRLGVPTDFLVQGIVGHVGLHVDPGYNGHLIVLFVNCGTHPVVIYKMDTILSLEIQRLDVQPKQALDARPDHGISWLYDYLPVEFSENVPNRQIHVHVDDAVVGQETYVAFLPGIEDVKGLGATRTAACEQLIQELLAAYRAFSKREDRLDGAQLSELKNLEGVIGRKQASRAQPRTVSRFCAQFGLEPDPDGWVFPKRGQFYLKPVRVRSSVDNNAAWIGEFCDGIGKTVEELDDWLTPDRTIAEFDAWAGWTREPD